MAGRSVLLLIGMVLLVLQTGTNANLWMRFGGWRFERRFLAEHRITTDNNTPLFGFAERVEAATGIWNDEFNRRGTAASATAGTGDLEIVVTGSMSSGGAFFGNRIYISSADWMDPNVPNGYIIALIAHEFGHAFGFKQVQCGGQSLMSDTNRSSYRTSFSDCDQQQLAAFLGIVPTRRDDDDDGYENDEDCAPNDASVPEPTSCTEALCDEGMIYVDSTGVCTWGSPIIIPLGTAADVRLTSVEDGVVFDLDGDSRKERISWTAIDTNASWLVLDRNGNGVIDDGTELFGNFSPQPFAADRNGFLALAVFDTPASGGNADGWIDSNDSVFAALQLWRDSSQDGFSQPEELSPVAESGVSRLALSYSLSQHRDPHGNVFRYRARIEGPRAPWAYDVFLKVQGSAPGPVSAEPLARKLRSAPRDVLLRMGLK